VVPCETFGRSPLCLLCHSTQRACAAYCPTGRFTEAAEKYARARDNLEGMANSEAVQVRRACVLNLSMCYLNTKKYTQCVECCQQVLAGEPRQQQLSPGTGTTSFVVPLH
jgi:hypothetical protein